MASNRGPGNNFFVPGFVNPNPNQSKKPEKKKASNPTQTEKKKTGNPTRAGPEKKKASNPTQAYKKRTGNPSHPEKKNTGNPTQPHPPKPKISEKKKQENAHAAHGLHAPYFFSSKMNQTENWVPTPNESKPAAQKIRKKVETNPRSRGLNKEKVCSRLAEVLFDVFQDDRQASDWNLNEAHVESGEADDDSAKFSDDDDDNYSELSQISMSRGLSQPFSQSSRVFKRSHDEYLKIGIFWDIENCAIPKGKSVLHFVKKLRDTFCEDYTEEKFVVVCNANQQSPAVAKDLSELMVRIEHVSPGKNAADEILRRNIREFTENKEPETKVVLITGDINFNTELHEMRYRKHFNVVLIHNKQTSEALKMSASQCILFEEFAADVPMKEASVVPDPVKVVVIDLPEMTDLKRIKGRLCPLVDPYGGKVLDLLPQFREALVEFQSETAANRAICALQNEDVFGSKIKFVLSNNYKRPKKNSEESIICSAFVSVCTDRLISLIVLGQILSTAVGVVENLSLVSSAGSRHCYTFVCHSSYDAGMIAQELKSMKGLNLYDIQVTKDGGKEAVSTEKTFPLPQKRISLGMDFEEAKNRCLRLHDAKHGALKKKLDSLMDRCNDSSSEEFKAVYGRLQLLELMRKEFLSGCQKIMEVRGNVDVMETQKMMLTECEYLNTALPVYAYRGEIVASVSRSQVTIVAGNPGCGKSTQVIQYIYSALHNSKCRIVCTEPHRTLASFVCNKVAKQSTDIGAESAVCDTSAFPDSEKRVLFVTDHFLLNECFTNASLMGYSHVIVDEAQVKSPATEVLLAYLKFVLVRRGDLKLVILCSVGKAKQVSKFFNDVSLVEIDNKSFPLVKTELNTTSENYIKDCVDLSLRIVSSEVDGNVLVVLPNIAVVNQTEKLLKSCSNITVVRLLFEVNFQEDLLRIQQSEKCCIVLCTREIITTVSIKNTKWIIDTGITTNYACGAFGKLAETVECGQLMKIMSNQIATLYSLKMADRVPNKLKTMPKSTVSQILSVLGLGMDPSTFKFLNPITVEDIQSSIKALEKMKAITTHVYGCGITRKGSMMLALALDVHLASFLLDAIDSGIGFVAVCFCALTSTAQYHTLSSFRANNINGNNLIELMKEYFQLQPTADDQVKNVDLQTVRSVVIDLENTLRSIHSQYNVKNDPIPSDWESKLQKLLLSSWEDNLCVQKKPTDLYECKSSQKLIGLLPYSDQRPQMIVFETIWKLYSMEYAATYIPIQLEDNDPWLAPKSSAKDMIVVHPLGYHIMRSVLVGKNGKLKEEWENTLSEIVKYKVSISHNAFRSEVKIHCNTEDKPVILAEVQKAIKSAQKNLSKQLWELVICPETGLKIAWQKRAEVLQLLMPNDSLTVIVFTDLTEPTDKVVQHFSTYGPIIHHNEKLNKQKKQVCLMYNNPTSAKKALASRNKRFSVRSSAKKIVPDALPVFTALKVSWTRRSNVGSAVVNFDKVLSPDVIVSKIFNGSQDTCYASSTICPELESKRIVFRKFNVNVSKTELEDDLQRKLAGVDVKATVNLTLNQIFSSSAESIADMEKKVMELVSPVLGKDIGIAIKKPEDRDEMWVARINTSDNTIKPKAIEALRHLKMDGCQLLVAETKYCRVFYSDELFAVHRNTFVAEVKHQMTVKDGEKSHFMLSAGTASNERAVISFEAGRVEDIIMTYQTLHEKFNGSRIDLSLYDFPKDFSLNAVGLSEKLAEVSKKRNAYIKYKMCANAIVVVGGSEAVKDVDTFLDCQARTFIANPVFSYACSEPKGMLYKMFDLYGPDLKGLLNSTSAIHLRLNITAKELMVWGNKEEVTAVLDFIKSADFDASVKEKQSPVQCPVCLDNPMKHEKNYRLEYCGHSYCSPCIGALIAHSDIPVICIAPGCNAPIVYRDLRCLQSFYPLLITNLATRATMEHIKQKRSVLAFCPVPDCDGVLLRNSDVAQCLNCFNALCLKCDVIFHYGQSCNKFQKENQSKTMSNMNVDKGEPKMNRRAIRKLKAAQELDPTFQSPNNDLALKNVNVMDAPLQPYPYVGIAPTVVDVNVMDTPLESYPYVGISPIPVNVGDTSLKTTGGIETRDLQFTAPEVATGEIVSFGVSLHSVEGSNASCMQSTETLEFLSVSAIDASTFTNDVPNEPIIKAGEAFSDLPDFSFETIDASTFCNDVPNEPIIKVEEAFPDLPDFSSSRETPSVSESVSTSQNTAVDAGHPTYKRVIGLRKTLVSANIFSGCSSDFVVPVGGSDSRSEPLKSHISVADTVACDIQPQATTSQRGSDSLKAHISDSSPASGVQSQVASSGPNSEPLKSRIAVSTPDMFSVNGFQPQVISSIPVNSQIVPNSPKSLGNLSKPATLLTHSLASDGARKSSTVEGNGKSDFELPHYPTPSKYNETSSNSGPVSHSASGSSSGALPKFNPVNSNGKITPVRQPLTHRQLKKEDKNCLVM